MNSSNQHVIEFLNRYVGLPEANYAVLLTGPWGCGKTFLVNRWKNNLSQTILKDKASSLVRPIYVSLFGLSSIADINQAITREIYPFMKSKLYSLGKTALNAVSSVTLNCDLSKITRKRLNGEVDLELDLVSLFKSDNPISENRIIIFDDFERCKAPIVDILGYINTFVEHSNIRVIILCNEDAFKKDERTDDEIIYNIFKEKVIGREFKVDPDVEAAVKNYCKQNPSIPLTKEQERIAIDTFKKTQYDNLRILQQSLQDYCMLRSELTFDPENQRQKKIIDGLLIQYIVAYNEYANSDKVRLWAQYEPSMINLLEFNILSGSSDRDEPRAILDKYSIIDSLTPEGSTFGYPMSWILNSIKTGADISHQITDYLNREEPKVTFFQHLSNYWQLEQSELDQAYNEATDYITNPDSDIIQIMQIVGILFSIEEKNIKQSNPTVLNQTLGNIKNIISNYTDITALESFIQRYQNEVKRDMHFSNVPEKMHKFVGDVDKLINNRQIKLETDEVKEIETIDDNTFESVSWKFFQHFGTTDVCKYATMPFFHLVDPAIFTSSVVALTNKNKMALRNLILDRYETIMNSPSIDIYKVEVDNLTAIRDNLREKSKQKTGIDLFDIEQFAYSVDKAISIINQDDAHS